jgi:S-layer homology domain
MQKERFWGALSLTLLLTSLSAVAQVQSPFDPVAAVVAAGWMNPDASGNFRSDALVSRAELATVLVKAFRLNQRQPQVEPIVLQDVPAAHWAYREIQIVLRQGIMTGYRPGQFYPEQRVTRAEAFSIFAQTYGVFQFPDATVNEILAAYPDRSEIPLWARKSMATALHEGFVNLSENQYIAPNSPMTRGDLAHALGVYLRRQQMETSGFSATSNPDFIENSSKFKQDFRFF